MDEKFEWVEIIEPSRHEHMFANLKTGQCLWDAPPGVPVKPTHENQWWELYDTKTKRYYYYNAESQETVWYKPKDGDIIPLSKLQMLKNKETTCLSSSISRKPFRDEINSDELHAKHEGKTECLYSGDASVGDFSRDRRQENKQMVRIKDTEIISSSNNTRRAGMRTLSVDNNIDPPAIKEKPKFSSLRLKAPPKPPRSSINALDRSGVISNASEVKAFDRKKVETERQNVAASVSSDESRWKCSESGKEHHSSKPITIHSSCSSTASENTILTITTHNSFRDDLHKDNHPSTLKCNEYASPSEVISTSESLSSFSPKEEKQLSLSPRNCLPLTTGYPPVMNVSKSTPVSKTVEYACPLQITNSNEAHSSSVSSEFNCNQYDIPSLGEGMSCPSKYNEYDTPVSSSDEMIIEPSSSIGSIKSHLNSQENTVTTTISAAHISNASRTTEKQDSSLFLHCSQPDIRATYENINVMFPSCKQRTVSQPGSEIITQLDSVDVVSERITQRSLEFPIHTVPIAPPPPKITPRRTMPSMYDNVSPGAIAVFDRSYHSSEFDDTDETCNSADNSNSPCGYQNVSGASEEGINPNSDLLEHDIPHGRYYHGNEMDSRSVTLPSPHMSPRRLPIASPDISETTPTKRNPTLVRMKSDPIVDVEKRAKISKTIGSIQSTFRPISMLNLSNNIASTRQSKQCRSEGDKAPNFHLSTHRTGFLRRRMSIHSMLSWSKSCIKKPMVFTREKSQRKEAVDIFKLILMCMGDKSTRRKHDDILVDIVTRGWSTPTLRDEIFIQLCKQTTGNKRIPSLKQGWELITACLSMFPPSNKFHSYLEGYVSRHLDSEDEHIVQANVSKYAKYCHKQLERICQHGAKRGLKGPTLEEIQASIKRVFNPSMFGNTLDDILEMQKDRFPEHRLPWILTTLTESVLQQNGLQTEGIFRVPGDIDDVNHMKLTVDQWQCPVHSSDPTVPASLLKLWFRDLYEPLIPQRFYDQCIHNCDDPDISLNIVNSLPPLNYLVFSYLIRLLQAFLIPENVALSKMDENNLAMVWAPNCLRCPSDDPREIFENTRKEMTFLRTVMNVLDTSFLEGVL